MLRIGRRPQPTGFFIDTDGVVRLMHPEPTWAETVDLAFTEIAIYGASSPAIMRRLAAAYERLHQSVPFDLRGGASPPRVRCEQGLAVEQVTLVLSRSCRALTRRLRVERSVATAPPTGTRVAWERIEIWAGGQEAR